MMDLHMHSNCSDGCFSPQELLQRAVDMHLRYFSITDHDNMDAYKLLESVDMKETILIPGVEMTCAFQGLTLDILGYGVDAQKMEAQGLFQHVNPQSIIQREQQRLHTLQAIAGEQEIQTSEQLTIHSSNERANDVFCDDILTYESNQGILQALGIKNRTTFYRNHYLNKTSLFYMEQESKAPHFETVVKAIHDSEGRIFLAHPFVYDVPDTWALIEEVYKTGCIDGIECFHRNHTQANSEALIAYCDEHKLYKSGGSDLHTQAHKMAYADGGKQPIMEAIIRDWYQ